MVWEKLWWPHLVFRKTSLRLHGQNTLGQFSRIICQPESCATEISEAIFNQTPPRTHRTPPRTPGFGRFLRSSHPHSSQIYISSSATISRIPFSFSMLHCVLFQTGHEAVWQSEAVETEGSAGAPWSRRHICGILPLLHGCLPEWISRSWLVRYSLLTPPKLFTFRFFIICGFSVCQVLEQSNKKPPFKFVLTFLASRFRKVVPLYLLVILLISLGILWLLPTSCFINNRQSALKALSFFSNQPDIGDDDYFEKVGRI